MSDTTTYPYTTPSYDTSFNWPATTRAADPDPVSSDTVDEMAEPEQSTTDAPARATAARPRRASGMDMRAQAKKVLARREAIKGTLQDTTLGIAAALLGCKADVDEITVASFGPRSGLGADADLAKLLDKEDPLDAMVEAVDLSQKGKLGGVYALILALGGGSAKSLPRSDVAAARETVKALDGLDASALGDLTTVSQALSA